MGYSVKNTQLTTTADAFRRVMGFVAFTIHFTPNHSTLAMAALTSFSDFVTPAWISGQPGCLTGQEWISAAIQDAMKISVDPRITGRRVSA